MMADVGVPPEVFDDDYLYFYADILPDERSDADAEVVARLLSLRPGMRVLDVPCGEGAHCRPAGSARLRGCRCRQHRALHRPRRPGSET
jgi:hypothetical protein